MAASIILDDATSEIYYAQLMEEKSTRTVMAELREVIETKGLFCMLYSDRRSHFFVTPKAGEPVDKHRLTQIGRAMKELGVQMIAKWIKGEQLYDSVTFQEMRDQKQFRYVSLCAPMPSLSYRRKPAGW